MLPLISRRIALGIVQLFLLSLLVFVLAEFMPGDALTGRIDPTITGERLAEIRSQLGLDKPWPVRYKEWVTGIFHGDFGVSYAHRLPVIDLVGEKFGNTVLLGVCSLLFCFGAAIPLGVAAGRRPGRLTDKLISGGSYVLLSTPQAVFGVLAIFLFAYILGWLPAGGSVDASAQGFGEIALSKLRHMILPAVTSAMLSIPVLTQLIRAEVVNNQSAEYIPSLRGRGLSENRIFRAHILRNSLIPAASLAGSLLAALLSGTVLVETVFSYPGIGKLFVDSILKRDYPTANFLILLSALLTVVGTLISDLLMHSLDPRVKMR